MGYEILQREVLREGIVRLRFSVPLISRRALAGQFVIVRADQGGERVPLTIAAYDRAAETVDLIVQAVGASTMSLAEKRVGQSVCDLVGPLGMPTCFAGVKRAVVVGGGVGCAIALPLAQGLREAGATVQSVIGFRSREQVILTEEFSALSERVFLTTDDGSAGEKGNVCRPLARLMKEGNIDAVFVAGPLPMMKYAAETTRPYGIKTVASMNPIMIDGTGMCGCCRVRVGGEMKFACVDGPDFDAHLIDFDEAISRLSAYRPFEQRARERHCNLLKKEED